MLRPMVCLVVIAAAVPAAAQVDHYVLRAEHVACLQANADHYRALPGDPLFIAVAECPQIPDDPLLGTLRAEGPRVATDPAARWDDFVYLTRRQLDCLMRAPLPADADLVRFRPTACVLEVEP